MYTAQGYLLEIANLSLTLQGMFAMAGLPNCSPCLSASPWRELKLGWSPPFCPHSHYSATAVAGSAILVQQCSSQRSETTGLPSVVLGLGMGRQSSSSQRGPARQMVLDIQAGACYYREGGLDGASKSSCLAVAEPQCPHWQNSVSSLFAKNCGMGILGSVVPSVAQGECKIVKLLIDKSIAKY